MNTQELLDELSRRGVRLWADGGELVINAPRGALDAELRRALMAGKGKLLGLLQDLEEGRELADLASLEPDREQRHESFPLTDIQQAYWIGRTDVAQFGRVGCHYYQEFEGSGLDLERLERSLQLLIERHDMLRAVVDAEGRQRILEQVPPYRIAVLDLRQREAEEVTKELEALREAMSHQVHVAERWPLYEVRAARLDGDRLRVHLSIDLLMIDAASLSRWIHDWRCLYEEATPPPALGISFRDYALAELARRETGRYRRALQYWDSRIPTLAPPPDLPRPHSTAWRGARVRCRRQGHLDAARWARLKEWAKERRWTPSGFLAAVFAEILGTWSSRSDRWTLNLTFCRRRSIHPQIEELLGDFTTTILLEVDRRQTTFEERALQLQRQLAADLDQAEVSGVEALRRRRQIEPEAVSVPVVFTSLLGHGEQPEVLFSDNWLGEAVYGISQTPQVTLDHQAYEEDGALLFNWDALESAYPEGLLDDMMASYGRLLRALADDRASWSDPEMRLMPAAQEQRRVGINATEKPYPESLLHGLFEHQARQRPEAVAVVSSGLTLSYGALERRSLALAVELRRLGADRDRLVAVVMEKGWEQIVAVLAILRSGAAYLPISADLPQARVRHLLERGEARVALTQSRIAERFAWPSQLARIAVDGDDLPEVADSPEMTAPLAAMSSPSDLAYTIFTSGSTGQPKGVMIAHQAAVNTLFDIQERFAVGPEDRVLALSSLSFDLSVYDIFGLLAAGGTIVLPDAGSDRDPAHWAQRVVEERITIWDSVPALMQLLVEYASGSMRFEAIRLVMLSGDWIPLSLPDRIRELAREAAVISLGGATEASIWSILLAIDRVDADWPSIPYGKPMANQAFHVLDRNLKPCPDWVPGELFIAGAGLAMGYWRDGEETARRFIHHPQTGERLYRTGDLGRYLGNGEVEILGRVDFQVKIRGHRIELGEIETSLQHHESVHSAVAAVHQDPAGERFLIAWVVPQSEASDMDSETLRSFLAESLPPYMVPFTVETLDALPLSANGKVDRTRLPVPEAFARSGAEDQAPANKTEERLAEIVRQVLKLDRISVTDRFAVIGATSVQMVGIYRQLPAVQKQKLTVAEMFNHADVRSLARFFDGDSTAATPRTVSRAAMRHRAELAARRKRVRGLAR